MLLTLLSAALANALNAALASAPSVVLRLQVRRPTARNVRPLLRPTPEREPPTRSRWGKPPSPPTLAPPLDLPRVRAANAVALGVTSRTGAPPRPPSTNPEPEPPTRSGSASHPAPRPPPTSLSPASRPPSRPPPRLSPPSRRCLRLSPASCPPPRLLVRLSPASSPSRRPLARILAFSPPPFNAALPPPRLSPASLPAPGPSRQRGRARCRARARARPRSSPNAEPEPPTRFRSALLPLPAPSVGLAPSLPVSPPLRPAPSGSRQRGRALPCLPWPPFAQRRVRAANAIGWSHVLGVPGMPPLRSPAHPPCLGRTELSCPK
ncbi:hypothetical protein PUNSTDRAFT_134425 [Punctularia strigosozonata HHB-11173 SS5]|uniref:uncharacterized protein n=1 Tax=Punctularia strigosozonata (strain HHB-11173) TaxID=741275 RepID=UPI000441792A|nr:uncharacterized protein PUNSTDRAFT_134425 [Punctularia strigosozonata HHB-11173 SS5]EIN09266.1 hypothetical protein PUNSTDRAFT_134425 [Punctularia strigosozonata HHB-11173 SS5]